MKFIRWFLGNIILFLNAVFAPSKKSRTIEQKIFIENGLQQYQIYQFTACPFCVKVRRFLHAQNIDVKFIDAKDPNNSARLLKEGGKIQVPCLFNSVEKPTWLYESSDIIALLSEKISGLEQAYAAK